MQFSHSDSLQQLRWQLYCQLENIPLDIQSPHTDTPKFLFGIDWLWRSLISLLADELVDRELQIEYLERCWISSTLAPKSIPSATSLQKFWALMN